MRLLLANLLGVVIMKIREFFKNCIYCHHVWIFVCRRNESGERRFIGREILNLKDFNGFINDYGDKELKEWSVENKEDDTDFTFYIE